MYYLQRLKHVSDLYKLISILYWTELKQVTADNLN